MSKLSVNTIAHTGGTTAMTVDSTGRILTPARPAFRAYLNANSGQSDWTFSVTPPKVVFDVESYDVGGNYDTGSSTFTAPITGLYHFDVNIYVSGTQNNALNWVSTYLFVDGVQVSRTIVDPVGRDYGAPELSDNLQLTAGQEVVVRLGVNGYNNITVHGDSDGSITNFSGYLIG
jgi:hypothetical protein